MITTLIIIIIICILLKKINSNSNSRIFCHCFNWHMQPKAYRQDNGVFNGVCPRCGCRVYRYNGNWKCVTK